MFDIRIGDRSILPSQPRHVRIARHKRQDAIRTECVRAQIDHEISTTAAGSTVLFLFAFEHDEVIACQVCPGRANQFDVFPVRFVIRDC